jgi:Trypsin
MNRDKFNFKYSQFREKNISVFLGSMLLTEYEETKIRMDIPDAAIFWKKEYNPKTYEDDLALIKLPWPAPMPTRNTNPSAFAFLRIAQKFDFFLVLINEINMPAASMRRTNLTNKVATISGWGRVFDSEIKKLI